MARSNLCLLLVWPILACASPSQAFAASNDKLAQRLAASCASCHGTAGVAVGDSLPALAGQSRDKLVSSMQAFKSGARPATVMQQLAKGYTDEPIALIATYFAGLKAAEAGGAK